LCINAFPVALGIEESADADLGVDLLGRDFQLQPGGSLPSPLQGMFCV
jgi:hypothetical protein